MKARRRRLKNIKNVLEKEKNMKKIINTILSGLLIITLSACSTSNKVTSGMDAYEKPELDLSNASGSLKDILDKGTLVIATSPDYPPNEFVDDEGNIYGSEMELAKYIASCLGVELSIEAMDFSGTLVAIDTGKVDIAVSGYGWKKDRAELYELSIGYEGDDTDYGHTLITLASEVDNYKSLEDFVGKKVMAQASSLQQMYVEDQILAIDNAGNTEMILVTSLDQAILGLASGKCDAVALDGQTARNYVNQSEGEFALTNINFDLSIYGDYEGNVIAAKKGETELIEVINTIIAFAMDKGYYQQWYKEACELAGVED